MIGHFVSVFHLQLYQFGCSLPPPPRRFSLVAALRVLCCEAPPAVLRLAPVPSRHEAVRRVDDAPVPVPTH